MGSFPPSAPGDTGAPPQQTAAGSPGGRTGHVARTRNAARRARPGARDGDSLAEGLRVPHSAARPLQRRPVRKITPLSARRTLCTVQGRRPRPPASSAQHPPADRGGLASRHPQTAQAQHSLLCHHRAAAPAAPPAPQFPPTPSPRETRICAPGAPVYAGGGYRKRRG